MLPAIALSYLKSKLFTPAGGFLAIFGIIIAVFLFSNIFGKKDTIDYKKEYGRLTTQLQAAQDTNMSLHTTIDQLRLSNSKNLETIAKLHEQEKVIDVQVVKYVETRKARSKPIVIAEKKDPVSDKIVVSFDKAEYDSQSAVVIDVVNTAYDELLVKMRVKGVTYNYEHPGLGDTVQFTEEPGLASPPGFAAVAGDKIPRLA